MSQPIKQNSCSYSVYCCVYYFLHNVYLWQGCQASGRRLDFEEVLTVKLPLLQLTANEQNKLRQAFLATFFDAIVLNVRRYNQTVLLNSLGLAKCVCSNWSLV